MSHPNIKSDAQNQILGLPQRAIPEKVVAKTFEEFHLQSPFTKFMGNSFNNAIVKVDLNPGSGLSFNMSKIFPLDYKSPRLNTDAKRGYEQSNRADTCPIYLNRYSFPLIIKDADLQSQASPIDLQDNLATRSLSQAGVRNLDFSFVREATWKLYPPTASLQTAGDMPVESRVVCGDGALTAGNVAGALTVGNIAGAYKYRKNGKLSDALRDVGKNLTPMSYKTLCSVVSVASNGGHFVEEEAPIIPLNVSPSGKGEHIQYCMFIPSIQRLALETDPEFQKLAITRYGIDNPQPLAGATYVCNIRGLYVYELSLLNDFFVSNGTDACSWSFLIGAGALGMARSGNVQIVKDDDPIEKHLRYALHDIRGHAALRYKSKTLGAEAAASFCGVEQGLIHVFNGMPSAFSNPKITTSQLEDKFKTFMNGEVTNKGVLFS